MVVGILEVVAIAIFHSLQRRSYETHIALSQIRAMANRLDALEWKALATGKLEANLLAEVTDRRTQMIKSMQKLSGLAKGCLPLPALRQSFEAYITAVDKEFDHIQKGEIQQAKWHDQRQVAPVFNKFKRLLRENEVRCEAYSRAFSRWDTWGTLAALLLASGGIILLLKHFLTAQELAVRSAADQRLIEVYRHTEAEIRQMNENLEWRVLQRTTQLRAANENLEKEMAERRRLETIVQQVSEREKQRLGRDLHDGVGQILTGAAMRSKALENRLQDQARLEADEVSQVTQLIGEALRLTRNLAGLLYPVELEKNGLVRAIQGLAVKLQNQFGVACYFQENGSVPMKNTDHDIHVYRIAQEATTNALRHGKASQIILRLNQHHGEVVLAVENDGPVISPSDQDFNGMGCRIMRYRAGMIGGVLQISALESGG